ncbi:MAG: hypothetical protein U9N34_03735 [Candidatus Cloacimonadota bacterium]|nr:hypothetical protein [Candidatus Cloacimonadota bacterium]
MELIDIRTTRNGILARLYDSKHGCFYSRMFIGYSKKEIKRKLKQEEQGE